MAYDIKDVKQAMIGSIIATLFFYMLRANEPIHIDPWKGLLIGSIWLWLAGFPFLSKKQETKIHFIGNIITSAVVCSGLALIFEMITLDELFSFSFFGSAAFLGILLAIPTATFFDKFNITNMYERWYHKKR